jgi:hypothetical protein
MNEYACQSCGKQFSTRAELQRHEKECAGMTNVMPGGSSGPPRTRTAGTSSEVES